MVRVCDRRLGNSARITLTETALPMFPARLNVPPRVVDPDYTVGSCVGFWTNIFYKPISLCVHTTFCLQPIEKDLWRCPR